MAGYAVSGGRLSLVAGILSQMVGYTVSNGRVYSLILYTVSGGRVYSLR